MRLLSSSFAAIAVVTVFGGVAADADAASPAAKIGSPRSGELVTTATVPVRLRTAPNVSRITVLAGSNDVSRRFTRRGRVWTGAVPRSAFGAGTDKLRVQAYAGRKPLGGDVVSFVIPTGKRASASVVSGARAAATSVGVGGPARATSRRPRCRCTSRRRSPRSRR